MTALALVDNWQPTDVRVRDVATAALRSMPADESLSLAVTDVPTLIRIYQRRLGRSSEVIGDGDFLDALMRHAEPEVLGAAISHEGKQTIIWLDTSISKVLGCVTGPDRRGDTP